MRGEFQTGQPADPGVGRIAAALRTTTETLARELARPGRQPPEWTDFEWRIAQAAAAMHGISALLHAAVAWRGPEPWQRFLEGQWLHSRARHALIQETLQTIDREARKLGVALVALKGAALYGGGWYRPGLRPMGDIDLLVRTCDAERAGLVLQKSGYVAAFASRRHLVFAPRGAAAAPPGRLGEHIDNPIKVEIHCKVAENLPVVPVDISQHILPSRTAAGINPYPSDASLALHLLLHAAGNIRARALRHVQLHDIALLMQRLRPADGDALFADGRHSWWMLRPLSLTARYYPHAVGPELLGRAEVACSWMLRRSAARARLTSVSWSQIRIEAFPGIEWSRTLGEAWRFMLSRIAPSEVALRELREGADQIPGGDSVPWYGLSHAARAVRWLLCKPPRVQTMLSVRAALAAASHD